ncbi:MAG: TonB family protein [Pyrinomonadaceae bacterium]|nr:TonB family protein [Pyrinomonadaceae bacterium]
MLTEKGNLISTSASIIRATSNGDPDAVRALLADGSDVDQRGRGGHTALMVAAIFGHVDIARLLLSAGANVQLQDNLGLTARDWADRRGSWEVAQLLPNASPEKESHQKTSLAEQAQLKVGVERRNPAADPKKTPQPDTLGVAEEQSRSEQGAVTNRPITKTTRNEMEAVRSEAERNLKATEPEIAPEADALRFMKFHKQIMAAQERLKAEQARQVTNDAPRLSAVSTSPSTGATHGEVEADLHASPIDTKDTPPQQDAPSLAPEQITSVGPERREKLSRPTATQSARIAVTIEHLRLMEESDLRNEGDPPAQSDWAAPTAVDQTLDHNEADITLERRAADLPIPPASVEPKTSESFNVPPCKRCPECNATYDNPLLKYCAYDAAKLIVADDPMFSPSATRDRSRQTLWVLVAIVTVSGASLGYLINNYRSRGAAASTTLAAASSSSITAVPNTPTATRTEEPETTRNDSPSISGELSGIEVDVPEPEYPAQARAEGVSGAVTVRVQVNKKGRVVLARSSHGDWRLRAAAVKAAQKATFSPEKLATRGKVVSGTITYNFVAQTESQAPIGSGTGEQSDSAPANESSSATASSVPSIGGDYPVVGGPLVGAESSLPQPTYPEKAKSKGINGTITVVVRVNRAGRVISWRTLEGDSQLRAAALKAAKRATFSPAKLPGKGEVVGSITYNFK